MKESLVKSAGQFANRVNKFSKLAQESYSVKQESKTIPLEYIRLNIQAEAEGNCTVIVGFHVLNADTGGIGDEYYKIDIDVPATELDKFLNAYKVSQVDSSKTRKDKRIDYYLNGFQGSYSALNFEQ